VKHVLNFKQFVNESIVNEASGGFETLMEPISKLKLTPPSTRTDGFKESLAQKLGASSVSELKFIRVNMDEEDGTPEQKVAMFIDDIQEDARPFAVWYEPDSAFMIPKSIDKKWYNENFYNSIKLFKDTDIEGLRYAISYTENGVTKGDVILIFPSNKASELIKFFK
jgi:hypothetical protein